MSASEQTMVPSRLRTPRAAAIAGIVFSLLLCLVFVLVRLSVPANPADAGLWLTDHGRRNAVKLALNLVPFAAIAFLWFMGVVRDRIGHYEDRFFATVFLGSGLLFVATLLAAAAVAGGILTDPAIAAGRAPSAVIWAFGRRTTFTLLNVYAIRMGAVFILSSTTIALRTGILPRWLVVAGYVVGVVLLLSVTLSPWMNLLFPAWTFVLSVTILVNNLRTEGRDAALSGDGPAEVTT